MNIIASFCLESCFRLVCTAHKSLKPSTGFGFKSRYKANERIMTKTTAKLEKVMNFLSIGKSFIIDIFSDR